MARKYPHRQILEYALGAHLHFVAYRDSYRDAYLINTNPTDACIAKYGIKRPTYAYDPTRTNNYGLGDPYGGIDYIFTVPSNTPVSYLDKCTPYPSYLTAKVKNTAVIKTLPCSGSTNSESKTLRNSVVGEIVYVTKMYKNSVGNYWFKIKTKNGGVEGYMYAGDVTVQSYSWDVSISGVAAPNKINMGEWFSVRGSISTSFTELATVGGYIFSGSTQKYGKEVSSPRTPN